MGMQVRLVLYASTEGQARAAATAAFAEVARLDTVFSDYRPDSEVRTLTAKAESGGRGSAGIGPKEDGRQPVSEELFFVLQRAIVLAERTAGAFDPAAGTLTALWRDAIAQKRLPTGAEIAVARAAAGYDKISLDAAARTVTITAPGVRLDLGAIAKGYILDRALAVLRDAGVDSALVEAGGDIVVGAAPPVSAGWRIAVTHLSRAGGREGLREPGPGEPTEDSGCVLTLSDAAVSTSGDHAQFLEIEGRRYSHTVDPRTGVGLTHGRSATVVAPEGITSDALSTALTVVEAAQVDSLLGAYREARALLSPTDCEIGGSRRKLGTELTITAVTATPQSTTARAAAPRGSAPRCRPAG